MSLAAPAMIASIAQAGWALRVRRARTRKRALLQVLQTQRGQRLVDALAASRPWCLSVAQLLSLEEVRALPEPDSVTAFQMHMALSTLYEQLNAQIGRVDTMQESLRSETVKIEAVAEKSVTQSMTTLAVSLAVVTAISFSLVLVFGRVLARPFQTVASVVQRIAGADYESEIPGTDYGDEAGIISRNLQDLRDKLRRAEQAEVSGWATKTLATAPPAKSARAPSSGSCTAVFSIAVRETEGGEERGTRLVYS